MGKLTSLLALCLVLSANALWAGEPDEASAKGCLLYTSDAADEL